MLNTNKKDLSKQWNLINEILQKNYKPKHSFNKLVTDNDKTLINTEDICNELNKFFINIGSKMATTIPTDHSDSVIHALNRKYFKK